MTTFEESRAAALEATAAMVERVTDCLQSYVAAYSWALPREVNAALGRACLEVGMIRAALRVQNAPEITQPAVAACLPLEE